MSTIDGTKLQISLATKLSHVDSVEKDDIWDAEDRSDDVRIEFYRVLEDMEDKFGVAMLDWLGFRPYNKGDDVYAVEFHSDRSERWQAWRQRLRQYVFGDLDRFGTHRPTEEIHRTIRERIETIQENCRNICDEDGSLCEHDQERVDKVAHLKKYV